MKTILFSFGMGLLSIFTPQTAAIQPAQQPSESITFSAPELLALDQQLQHARMASAENNFEEAIELFENLEESGSHRHRWAAISGQTNIYRRQHNFDAARAVTARASTAEPAVAGLMHIWNGDIDMQNKDYEAAITEYQTAEQNYGNTIVNNMIMGELALKQATRAAIQFQHPDQAAQFSRKMANTYPTVGNPEVALAKALLYETMAKGDLPTKTLETVLHDGICTAAKPCFIAQQRLQKETKLDQAQFQKLGGITGIVFVLNDSDRKILENIRQPQQLSIQQSLLHSLVPAVQAQTVSYTTCAVEEELAYDGFSDPITGISRGDLFMGYPASASTDIDLYHPGVDLNNADDHVGGDVYDCSNPEDDFTTTAAGCVQDASTADWGSLAITHNYTPYDGDFASDYTTSQYGHADEIYVSVGDAVGAHEEVGSIGGINDDGDSEWACHLHFEIREPDHPDPYNAGYWDTSVLSSQTSVGLYYQDPESFIDAHPAFDWVTWIDESSSQWSYDPDWTYINTKGNGNDEGENDLNYTSTTAAPSPTATATLSFTVGNDGIHRLWMFVPWSTQSKSDSVPVVITSADDGSTVVSTTLNFYGNEEAGTGTCDEDIDGDGVWNFAVTKRCDEWIEIGSVYLTKNENYELTISNATGANGDIIIIDDLLITYGDNIGLYKVAIVTDDENRCTVPLAGDWTVSSDCTLNYAATAPGNVIVTDNKTLTINGAGSLNMDLSSYYLRIQNNARVIIEIGGKIY
ncbi:MAG: hypothetical protein HYV33_02555 [Candidatus Kerfeldbacteria bacterium]|nr:hypothetical protein [Candidatus Kerfeldbacteria bacterium]